MIRRQSPSLRIGYLPFYVDYYEGICPDFPREKTEVARRCSDTLSSFGQLLWDGKLIESLDAAEGAGKRLASEKPDCVVVVTTIAVFGGICWTSLKEIDAPILIWNPQLIESVGTGYTMEDIVRNTSQIGTQALANTLLRRGRSYRVVTGYWESERTMWELERFFAVIRTVEVLRKARFLAIGDVFPLMTDILIDEGELKERIGATIVRVSKEELTERYLAVLDEQVASRLIEMQRDYPISELTEDEAQRSARLSHVFSKLVDETEADGGTFNCHAEVCLRNPRIGITACYGHGLQNSLGRPFTCTGDLPTAVAMLLLKELTGVAMYTEVQIMDESREAIVIANSGEGEDGIRRKGCPSAVIGNRNFKGLEGRGASFAYPLQTGPATLFSLTPTSGNYRLIVAEGEILDDTLPDAGALAGFFRFSHTDLHTGYTRWLEAGAIHHATTSLGHWAHEIKEVGRHFEFEVIEI